MPSNESIKSQILSWNHAEAITRACDAVNSGGTAIVPTETIYGLTCNALKSEAVRSVYEIKGRDLSKSSAVFVASSSDIAELAHIADAYIQRIIAKFLPGPLTLIARAKRTAILGVVGNDGKIGIRVSSHPFVQALCGLTKAPLIATSANFSGQPDCRSDSEILATFDGIVPVIILGRSTMVGRASTVIDVSGAEAALIREGTIPFSQVLNCAEERVD
ncbi:MAG: L-threonylcarbamoyladenylate synthase [Candidatus Zixiibacteriota bacterium]